MVSPPNATLLTIFLAALAFGGLLVIGRMSRKWTAYPAPAAAWLGSAYAPIVAGILTLVIVRVVWGSFNEPGVVHDERAYLLQGRIFAQGRWAAPSPPIPAFFEQMHVFVEPAVFAKYPPAHALTLVPGIWLGLPGLVPAVLAGISGTLVFWLGRRLANEYVALLTWWLWTSAWATLMWAASYFSESVSTTMFLIAVWATIRWLDSQRNRYLLAVAGALAWGLDARPLTMAALALPIAFVIGRRIIAIRAWKALVAPVVLGSAILLINPIWQQETLGDWRINPYSYYSRVYFPFDKPGFGVDASAPLRTVPPEIAFVGDWSRDVHERHEFSAIPSTLAARLFAVVFWSTEGWRLAIGVLILAGALHGGTIERFGLCTVALLFLAYLAFAHPPMWIVYYVEVLPILYFLAACQLGRLFFRSGGLGRDSRGLWPASVANAFLAAVILLLPFGVIDILRVRSAIDERNGYHRAAERALAAIPSRKGLVFVHYPPAYNHHLALTRNEPDPASARLWVVYDRGARNAELQSHAPDRAAYRIDAGTLHVEPLDRLDRY